jgi:spermidine synthase
MRLSRLTFYWVVAVPGGILMALEIVSSRVLAPAFGNSVYVWGSIIGIFLAAMSIGYVLGGRLADLRPQLASLGQLILGAALAQVVVLLAGTRLVAWLGELTQGSPYGTLLATSILFGPATVLLATVAPFAVKLATRNLDLLGGTAGHLYALSTAGSLVGTLGATFGLIPYLNLDAILRVLLALTVLTAAAALASSWRRQRLAAVLALSLLVLVVAPTRLPGPKGARMLADRITPYQTIRITESDGVRFFRSDGAVHSALVVETGESWLTYLEYTPAALLLNPDVKSVLFLGMGGGTAGIYLRRHMPELQIEYVEIDPAVPELASELMFFQEDANMRVHVDDARRFLARTERRWDYVFSDTYIGHSIPFHLATREFFGEVKRHLNPGGVCGLNLAASPSSPFGKAILRSVRAVFHQTLIFRTPRQGNLVVMATDRRTPIGREELRALAAQLETRWDFTPTFTEMVERLHPVDLELLGTPVLTDSYAPVNHLIHLGADPTEVPGPPPSGGQ